MTRQRIRLDDLPPQARQIADLIGVQGVLQLAEYRGGRWMYIPKDVDMHHPLAERLGLKRARKLCRRFGGERIMMPACVSALRALRDEEIYHRHYVDGISLDDLAYEYQISQRSVLRAIARRREDNNVSHPCRKQLSIL